MGNVGPIVLRSDSFRRCWVLCTRHRFCVSGRNGNPGWGLKHGLSLGSHPVGNHSVYIFIKGEGALGERLTAAPLSHYFSAPVLEQERSAASPCPPHLHLDNGTQNMISSLALKQSIVIVDFQSCVDLRELQPFGRARRSKFKRRDYGERRPSQ